MTLLAAYSFDETGPTVLDTTGNGHNFTLTGQDATRTPTGHTGGGLTSTAADLTTPLASPAFGQSADRTVMLWAQGGGEVWYVRWNVASIDSGAWGILALNGDIGAQARNGAGFVRALAPIPAGGGWHHYAATYQATTGTVTFHVDGAAAATATIVGPLRTDADMIDIVEWGSSTTVDDLRIYDEALTAAAITAAMNTPVGAPITHPLGSAVEVGSARPAGRGKRRAAATSVEGDVARPVDRSKGRGISSATEGDIARPAAPAKIRAVAQAVDGGTPLRVHPVRVRALTWPTETGYTRILTPGKARPTVVAEVRDTAAPVVALHQRRIPAREAFEDEQARPVTTSRRRSIGRAVEVGTILPMIVIGPVRVVSRLTAEHAGPTQLAGNTAGRLTADHPTLTRLETTHA